MIPRAAFLVFVSFVIALVPSSGAAEKKQEAVEHLSKGKDAAAKNDFEKAVIEFEQAYELDPDYKTLYEIARVEASLKNYDRAIEKYSKFLRDGQARIGKPQREAVRAEINRLKELIGAAANREKAYVYLRQGRAFYDKGQYERAALELKHAYDLDSSSYIVLYAIAQVETALKRYPRAIEAYRQCLEIGGSSIPEDTQKTVQSQVARLEAVVKSAKDQETARAHVEQGRVFYEKEQYERALNALSLAYSLVPAHTTLFAIGQTQTALGNYPEAIDAYQKYLDQGGDKVAPDQKTKVKGEITRLNSLLAEGAGNKLARTHEESGLEFFDKGQYERALTEFTKAYEISNNHQILYSIGMTHTKLGSHKKAIEAYAKYLEQGEKKMSSSAKDRSSKRNEIIRRAKVRDEIERLKGLSEAGILPGK